ncbi:sigma-70 family RNA polymerase sigma factor [Patulibacter defluvii]|uniref:sigma-70 family RNA polymerase sigma factor n=1 Tax=Patulibacter defluvii TaxID=3095358 RepID=UPI002A759153|nr:sigma-70 family RNA polymerase sigma factor [Patulibacter sp. DM4]
MHASAPPGSSAVPVAPPDPRRVRSTAAARPDHGDGALVELAGRGDPRAFELLFRRHRDGIQAYAHRMLTDHARAEDVVQEVFFSAMRALQAGQRPTHLRAWLHEIARRACIDQWRGTTRRGEVSFDDTDRLGPADARRLAISDDTALRGAGDREALTLLRSAFGELSQLQHDVLVQRELEGRSTLEIAERLGISRSVVEGQLARGRRSLTVAYRELQSGERCRGARTLCDAAADRSIGVRERRRLAVHLRTCEPCRRHAAVAGVDVGLLDQGVLAKVALLLPVPLLKRLPFGEPAVAGEAAGGLLGGKMLVGAALVAASGTGAIVVTDVAPVPRHTTAIQTAAAPIDEGGANGGGSGGHGAFANAGGGVLRDARASAPTGHGGDGTLVAGRDARTTADGAQAGSDAGQPGTPGARHAGGPADEAGASSGDDSTAPLRQPDVMVPGESTGDDSTPPATQQPRPSTGEGTRPASPPPATPSGTGSTPSTGSGSGGEVAEVPAKSPAAKPSSSAPRRPITTLLTSITTSLLGGGADGGR